jgi:hypothetical protein
MSALVSCKACGKEVAKGVKKCVHCGKDQRNWFMRHKIMTFIGGVVIIGAIGGAIGGGEGVQQASTTPKTTETTAAPAETKKEEVKKITLADYNAIVTGDSLTGEGGMAYEEAVAKFGEPSTKSESQSGDMKMIMAGWTKHINGDLGANFNMTFINGKAASKSQMGMK